MAPRDQTRGLSIARVVESTLPVFLRGGSPGERRETARRIHDRGALRRGPLLHIDCGTASGVERLFDHRRLDRPVADESWELPYVWACGGTLYLERVERVPADLQRPLNELIRTRRFVPSGDRREIEGTFRLISSASRDLVGEVGAGRFREDLLYRLHVLLVDVPPVA